MREIKFRVWDHFYNKFYYSKREFFINAEYQSINFNLEGDVISAFDLEDSYPNVIIQQYTGLKDKNGKEIYEGDQVRCNTGWEGNILNFFEDVVKFEQGMFGVKLKQHGQQQLKLTGFKTIEVIGNVYENPELVKESKDEM